MNGLDGFKLYYEDLPKKQRKNKWVKPKKETPKPGKALVDNLRSRRRRSSRPHIMPTLKRLSKEIDRYIVDNNRVKK